MIRKNSINNAIGSGIAIFNENHHILLQHRKDDHKWGLPGGILEIGESTEACARREVFEETNLVVGEMSLFNVYSGSHMYWMYPDGNEYYFTSIMYLSHDYTGELKADTNESFEVKFFSLDNLPKIISTNHKMIEELKEYVKNRTNEIL